GLAYDGAHGQVLMFGGANSSFPIETWVWDGNWIQKTAGPIRYHHAMAYDGAQVVLFGGKTYGPFFGDTWAWDGSTWTQQSPATSPAAREAHAMAYDPSHAQVVLFGGDNG